MLFGELLPEQALAEAQALALEADLMICVGSSLEVYPVAGLPGVTHGAGGRLALVTQGPTPYDDEAEVKLDGDVVEELARRAARRSEAQPLEAVSDAARPPSPRTASVSASTGSALAQVAVERGVGGVPDRPAVPGQLGTASLQLRQQRLQRHARLQGRLARAAGVEVRAGAQHQLLASQRVLARRRAAPRSAPRAPPSSA